MVESGVGWGGGCTDAPLTFFSSFFFFKRSALSYSSTLPSSCGDAVTPLVKREGLVVVDPCGLLLQHCIVTNVRQLVMTIVGHLSDIYSLKIGHLSDIYSKGFFRLLSGLGWCLFVRVPVRARRRNKVPVLFSMSENPLVSENRAPKKKRLNVWDDFEEEEVDGVIFVTCLHCQHWRIRAHAGRMTKHLAECNSPTAPRQFRLRSCYCHWQVDCIESVVKNKEIILKALATLLRRHYSNETFNTLSWVWTEHHWTEFGRLFGRLLEVGVPLRTFCKSVQADGNTQGAALHHFLQLFPRLEAFGAALPAAISRKFQEILSARKHMLMSEYAMASYLLDSNLKGTLLSAAEKREVSLAVSRLSEKQRFGRVCNHIPDFLEAAGPFSTMKEHLPCRADVFWRQFNGHPLSKIAVKLSCIPSSSAAPERIFSAADFVATNRERLDTERLAEDVFLRVNRKYIPNTKPVGSGDAKEEDDDVAENAEESEEKDESEEEA